MNRRQLTPYTTILAAGKNPGPAGSGPAHGHLQHELLVLEIGCRSGLPSILTWKPSLICCNGTARRNPNSSAPFFGAVIYRCEVLSAAKSVAVPTEQRFQQRWFLM
ncbi:hypothetical protein NHF46_22570 [Arthrobacter alpinus]|nr:hypothetical protein [Arthrobacter alpinus]